MLRMICPLFVCLLVMSLSLGHGRTLYMDSPTACGNTFSVGDDSVIVKPRGTVGVSNPPASCTVYLESSYSSSNYKFEIVVEAASFRDCGLTLGIYDGPRTGGNDIRTLGCGSTASTGQFYSKDKAITLRLTRTRIAYILGSDFSLRVQVYKAADGPDEYLGTYKFPAGAIIGIVLGFIVLIAFCVLLGWCYKTGRIAGLGGSGNDYPSNNYKASNDNLARSQGGGGDGFGGNENNTFKSWHNTEKMSNMSDSRSNFDLDDNRIWDSLTNTSSGPKNNNDKILNTDTTGGRSVAQGRFSKSMFNRGQSSNLSSSPRSRLRVNGNDPPGQGHGYGDNERRGNGRNEKFDRGELGLRGNERRSTDNMNDKKISLLDEIKQKRSSGLFENPDKDGYLYDYDQVKKLSGDKDDATITKKSETKDFATELQNAIKRNSLKRQKSENQSDSAPGGPSSESGGELDKIKFTDGKIPAYDVDSTLSSSAALNNQKDGESTGPDAQSSPKPTKKKRKNSKSPKSRRKNKDTDENEIPKSPKSKLRHKTTEEERDLPPEVFAPIFSDDETNTPDYPSNQYQPGYQGNYPPVPAYDPRYPMGYPPGMPGFYPGAPPYQQAGQAQWYVENQPNGQQKMAFAMTTHSQSDDSMNGHYGDGGHPGVPGYTSTPYYSNQYGAPQGHKPYDRTPGGPGMNNSLVPAGTILDDPQVPPPGMSLARYDDDPNTGIKTAQVIWTDSKPDPTDPPPGENPQITRKTITRITTKSTQDDLPDAPNPSLQDMSFKTAQQMQASGQEPAFMSPSRRAPGHTYPHSAIQYAPETPERSNAAFYAPSHHAPQYIPGSPAPVVHDAPRGNQAIRDRITLNETSTV